MSAYVMQYCVTIMNCVKCCNMTSTEGNMCYNYNHATSC